MDTAQMTGRELDGEIAVLLGWTATRRLSGSGRYLWTVKDERGKVRDTDIVAEAGDTAAFMVRIHAAPFSSDANDALSLTSTTSVDFTLHGRIGEWTAKFNGDMGKADTPALAICRAWLALMDRGKE